jgi:hypothetical protein
MGYPAPAERARPDDAEPRWALAIAILPNGDTVDDWKPPDSAQNSIPRIPCVGLISMRSNDGWQTAASSSGWWRKPSLSPKARGVPVGTPFLIPESKEKRSQRGCNPTKIGPTK